MLSIIPKCNLDSITLSQLNTAAAQRTFCCVTGADPESKPDPDYAAIASTKTADGEQASETADVTDVSVPPPPPPPPPPRVIQHSAAAPVDMFKRALKTERPAYYCIRLYKFGAHVNDSHLDLFKQHGSRGMMIVCRMLREYTGKAPLWSLCARFKV